MPGPQGPVGPNGPTPQPYRVTRQDALEILTKLGITVSAGNLHIRKIRGGNYQTGRIIK